MTTTTPQSLEGVGRRPWWGDWSWWALGLILAVGAWLRFSEIGTQSFWLDEIISIGMANGHFLDPPMEKGVVMLPPPNAASLEHAKPLWWIWSGMKVECHPPLYPMLLRVWREAFGESDMASRTLSAILSLAAVGLIFLVARLEFGRAAAFWAALLMALAKPQLTFAKDARPYSLLLVLMLGAVWALLRIKHFGWNWRRGLALGVLVFLLPLTHYFTFGALLAIGVYVLLALRGREQRNCVLTLAATGVVYLAAWGPILLQQRGNIDVDWVKYKGKALAYHLAMRMANLPVSYLGEPITYHSAGGSSLTGDETAVWGGAVVWVLPLLLLRRRPKLLLPYLWLTLTVAFPLLLDITRHTTHIWNMRYVLLASPAFYLLLVSEVGAARGAVRHRWRWAAHLLPAAAAVFCLLSSEHYMMANKAPWRELGQYVKSVTRPGDVVIYAPLTDAGVAWHRVPRYIGVCHYGYRPDVGAALLDGSPPGGIEALPWVKPVPTAGGNYAAEPIAAHPPIGNVWVITDYSGDVKPGRDSPDPKFPDLVAQEGRVFPGLCCVWRTTIKGRAAAAPNRPE